MTWLAITEYLVRNDQIYALFVVITMPFFCPPNMTYHGILSMSNDGWHQWSMNRLLFHSTQCRPGLKQDSSSSIFSFRCSVLWNNLNTCAIYGFWILFCCFFFFFYKIIKILNMSTQVKYFTFIVFWFHYHKK